MGQDTREKRVVVNGSGHQREEGGGEWGRTPGGGGAVNGSGHQREEGGGEWGRVVNGERVKRTWRNKTDNKTDQPGHFHEQVKQVPVVSAWKYQRVVGSNPCRSGGRIVFSKVSFLY